VDHSLEGSLVGMMVGKQVRKMVGKLVCMEEGSILVVDSKLA
jgi:hypothetical protein